MTVQYVMYFWFCGWRHVCPQWAIWHMANMAYTRTRQLHGDGDDGNIAVTAVVPR